MKEFISDIIYVICFIKWSFICLRRVVRGGWFSFRDAPTWFIKEAADMDADEYEHDADLVNYRNQAVEELKLRSRKTWVNYE